MDADVNPLVDVYQFLLNHYGKQAWWPAEDHFEVMVGAILTQNTAWTNVEKALQKLKSHNACNSLSLVKLDQSELAQLIRSSGYYNQKAERLKLFALWFEKQGGFQALQKLDTRQLRESLLSLRGIGEETADDILLYAFERTSFVIDTYTRRIFSRLGLMQEKQKYNVLQANFQQAVKKDVAIYKQYHALIVTHAKQYCMKNPQCGSCPLCHRCEFYHAAA